MASAALKCAATVINTVISVEKNEINYSSDFTHENQYFAFVLDSECKINTRGFNKKLIWSLKLRNYIISTCVICCNVISLKQAMVRLGLYSFLFVTYLVKLYTYFFKPIFYKS